MKHIQIDSALVRTLIAQQFPRWRDLPVRPVARDGHDNRSFHLGDDMIVRMPSAACYAPQTEKERVWLPRLAPHLPLPVSAPLAVGGPGGGYPWAWSVCPYLGETAGIDRIADRGAFARDLAEFLRALQGAPCGGRPSRGGAQFLPGGNEPPLSRLITPPVAIPLALLAGCLDIGTMALCLAKLHIAGQRAYFGITKPMYRFVALCGKNA